ncbi:MAG: type II toxin-antitoxin system prevent-host-death family antitoxin [Verrucomicrobiota bacterium]
MSVINIQAAKTQLSRLVEEAAAGKEIVIGKAGRPMVVLTPWCPASAARVGGQLAGQIWESRDCWNEEDDPLGTSDEDQKLFETRHSLPGPAPDPPA